MLLCRDDVATNILGWDHPGFCKVSSFRDALITMITRQKPSRENIGTSFKLEEQLMPSAANRPGYSSGADNHRMSISLCDVMHLLTLIH